MDNSSDKRWHPERRSYDIFHPPVEFTEAARTAEYRSKGSCGKTAGNQLCTSNAPATEDAGNLFECQSTTTSPRSPETRRRIAGKRLNVQQLEDWH